MARSVGSWQLDPVPIGSGSFAIVWKARHVETGQQGAVKEINTERLSSKLLESLESEIAVLRRTQHRHIVRMLDLIQEPGKMFLVLEFCGGGDLGQYLRRYRSVSEPTARYFMHQLSEGLRELYGLNVLHRDLKPQNLLLSDTSMTPILKIADFGFARSLHPQGMAETLCGSPLYMAPEILQSQKYDAKADLWSVGTILHELLTGRPPFTGTNHIQLLHNIQRLEPKLGDALPPHLSAPCRQLLLRLLRHRPQDRMGFEEFFQHPFVQGQLTQQSQHGQQEAYGPSPAHPAVQQQGGSDAQQVQHGAQVREEGLRQDSSFAVQAPHAHAHLQQQQHRASVGQMPGQVQHNWQEHEQVQIHRQEPHVQETPDQRQGLQSSGHQFQQPGWRPDQHQAREHQHQRQEQAPQQGGDSDCEYVVVSSSNSPAPNLAEQQVAAAFPSAWTQSAHAGAGMGPSASIHMAGTHTLHPQHQHHHHHRHHHHHHQHQHHGRHHVHHAHATLSAVSRRAAPAVASMASAWAAAAQAVATVARSVQQASPVGTSRQAAAAANRGAAGTFFHYPQLTASHSPGGGEPVAGHGPVGGSHSGVAGGAAGGSGGRAPHAGATPFTGSPVAPVQEGPSQALQQQHGPLSGPLTIGRRETVPAAVPAAVVTPATLQHPPPPQPAVNGVGQGSGLDAALLWRCARLPERLDAADLLQRVILLLMESATARVTAAEAAEAAAEDQEAEDAGWNARPAEEAGSRLGIVGGSMATAGSVAAGTAEAAEQLQAMRRRHSAQASAGALPGQLLALHLYACQLLEAALAGALGPIATQSDVVEGHDAATGAVAGTAPGSGTSVAPAMSPAQALSIPGLPSQDTAGSKAVDAGNVALPASSAEAASHGASARSGGIGGLAAPAASEKLPADQGVPSDASEQQKTEGSGQPATLAEASAAATAQAQDHGDAAAPHLPPSPIAAMAAFDVQDEQQGPEGTAAGSVPSEQQGRERSGGAHGLHPMSSFPRSSGFASDPRLLLPLKRQAASLLMSLKGRAMRQLRGQVADLQQVVGRHPTSPATPVPASLPCNGTAAGATVVEIQSSMMNMGAPQDLATAFKHAGEEGACSDQASAAVALAVQDSAQIVLDAAMRYARAAAADELLGLLPASVDGYARAADLLLFLLVDLPSPATWNGVGTGMAGGTGKEVRQAATEVHGSSSMAGAAAAASPRAATTASSPRVSSGPLQAGRAGLLPEHLKPRLGAQDVQRVHSVYAAVKLRQAACMTALNAQLSK